MSNDKDLLAVVTPCIAQVGPPAVDVTLAPLGNCCANIVQTIAPLSILMKEIQACILKGTIVCGSSQGAPGVEGVIVVATAPAGVNYVGVTNANGQYSICVPAVTTNLTYSLAAYCCGGCTGTVCTDTGCNCRCKKQT